MEAITLALIYTNTPVGSGCCKSLGLNSCACEPEDSETPSTTTAAEECPLTKMLKAENVSDAEYDKVYGILQENEEPPSVTWRELLVANYSTAWTFDPDYNYTITFDSGLEVDFDDKVTDYMKAQNNGPEPSRSTIVQIKKMTKKSDNSDIGDCVSQTQWSSDDDEPSEIFVFGAKDFPGSKFVTTLEFARLFG